MTDALPFFVTIPHSGENVPEFCDWLQSLPEEILMCDVDRYVDILYEPTLVKQRIPLIKTQWHRYAADLNRIPEDVDCTSVQGNSNAAGTQDRGFHWVVTTQNQKLMTKPMSLERHQQLVKMIYEPFHQKVRAQYQLFETQGAKNVFHLDAHSMPSLGTKMHRDPGEYRADIVISDCKGQSAKQEFVDLVIAGYVRAGFKVRFNWPYFGGRVSELYGNPKQGHHAIQVEMNRALYMDEVSKKIHPTAAADVQKKIQLALEYIRDNLRSLV